jgi:hypothetical protein
MTGKTDLSRRIFLASTAGLLTCPGPRILGEPSGRRAVALGDEHDDAANRRRRIVVQYDAWSQLGLDFDQWLDYRFDYIDEPGSQIDSVWWDITALGYATYPSKVLEPFPQAGLDKWREQGIDWVERLVAETKKRELEVFWSHRISEVELNEEGTGAGWQGKPHPIKQAHPDWVIKTWWKQGLWNLAVPGVRELKVRILREMAENYDFDGFQIDFARHVPCLPPGRQWELRGHVTEFVRMVRWMLLEVAKNRGRPLLLAARVPCNLDGCRQDGFDIAEWAREHLVDILTLGARSIDCDIDGFRQLTRGRNIKLQPCHDDHHATDAYQYPPIEFFRGVAANWWHQGADSIMTFNWSNARPELCRKVGATPGPASQRQAYHEIGDPRTLRGKDKMFVVQRRGGYPWAEGYFNRNDDAVLPFELPGDGQPRSLQLRVGDHLGDDGEQTAQVILRLVVFGADESDEIEVELNGASLALTGRDHTWKDRQIFSPRPQPPSGGADHWKINPNQKLLRLDYQVAPRLCKLGLNQVTLRYASDGSRDSDASIKIEKVEVHVRHTRG